MAIEWETPYEYNGIWWQHVTGLKHTQLNALYRHEVCKGSFVFPHPASGKAEVRFNSEFVKQYGAIRCGWILREEVVEEADIPLASWWNKALTDAISRPNHFASNETDIDDVEGDLSPYGDLP